MNYRVEAGIPSFSQLPEILRDEPIKVVGNYPPLPLRYTPLPLIQRFPVEHTEPRERERETRQGRAARRSASPPEPAPARSPESPPSCPSSRPGRAPGRRAHVGGGADADAAPDVRGPHQRPPAVLPRRSPADGPSSPPFRLVVSSSVPPRVRQLLCPSSRDAPNSSPPSARRSNVAVRDPPPPCRATAPYSPLLHSE